MKAFAVPGFLPIIHLERTPDALPIVEALLREHVNAAEILYCEEALTALNAVHAAYPEMIMGVGQVTSLDQCRQAYRAGAQFISMPYFCQEMVSWCAGQRVEAIPTCVTASEIACAQAAGAQTIQVRFSNVDAGIERLREYFALFPSVKFIPSGSVLPEELPIYIASPAVSTVCADWICSNTETSQIQSLCRQAHKSVMGFELAHVGINCPNLEECEKTVQQFADIFGFSYWDNGNSIYASNRIEVMKFNQIGSLGHLAICSNSVERAALELSRKGMTAIESTAKYKDGRLAVVYYQEEIGHFGIHLFQRKI